MFPFFVALKEDAACRNDFPCEKTIPENTQIFRNSNIHGAAHAEPF